MMFEFSSFNLINEFEQASNELNAKQLESGSAQLQPYRCQSRIGACEAVEGSIQLEDLYTI